MALLSLPHLRSVRESENGSLCLLVAGFLLAQLPTYIQPYQDENKEA